MTTRYNDPICPTHNHKHRTYKLTPPRDPTSTNRVDNYAILDIDCPWAEKTIGAYVSPQDAIALARDLLNYAANHRKTP